MQLEDIFKKRNITAFSSLQKGWSADEKLVLQDALGRKYLLRLSAAALYEKKRAQYALLQKLESLHICCSRPLAFGTLVDGRCYTLLSFLEGEDGEEAVGQMNDKAAYALGLEAGTVLKQLHNVPVCAGTSTWWEKYREKIPRKIRNLQLCPYTIPMQNEILSYYKSHAFLMKDRPQTFCHGDYHLGNMIVQDGRIGVIDFDKNGVADPYDDLKPFCWNVMQSEYFETGLINGYFDNNIPADFFPILKFYTAESMISHLPWAVRFGEREVATARKINACQMQWWDSFSLDVPTWYKGTDVF